MRRIARYLGTPPGLAVSSLVLAFFAVGVLAAYLPRQAPLAAPVTLVVLAAALCAAGGARAGREGVAANVARPTLAAALVAGAFAELVFAYDGTRGAPLAIVTASLALVVLDLPLLLGSSIAAGSSA